MKERLLLLYKLNRIDRELNELHSLKGDIPARIEELTVQKNVLDDRISELQEKLKEVTEGEQSVLTENEALSKKIDKNDDTLRSGNVKSNDEYNALAREIEHGYEKIQKNELVLEQEYKGKKDEVAAKIDELQVKLNEINTELVENNKELGELNKQTQEEENELNKQREELVSQISQEDIEFYDRINKVRFGEAVAVVRKNSCLGCYSSIPPQRAIEIRTADKFFNCENCGRILIAEELILEQNAG
jgi:predicted  nucleic acid-binding Zn-ribbon protein